MLCFVCVFMIIFICNSASVRPDRLVRKNLSGSNSTANMYVSIRLLFYKEKLLNVSFPTSLHCVLFTGVYCVNRRVLMMWDVALRLEVPQLETRS